MVKKQSQNWDMKWSWQTRGSCWQLSVPKGSTAASGSECCGTVASVSHLQEDLEDLSLIWGLQGGEGY